MKDDDIHTEYPADVDDENLSERGFQSASPGEATKLCSALALFRLSRIMSHILSEVYPAATSHETSLQKIAALSDELDEWRDDLASHLRLQFVQDKPSTKVVSSRSPLLVSQLYIKPPQAILTQANSLWRITIYVLYFTVLLHLQILDLRLHHPSSLSPIPVSTSSRSFSSSKNGT